MAGHDTITAAIDQAGDELVGLDHEDLEQVEEEHAATIRRSKADHRERGPTVALP